MRARAEELGGELQIVSNDGSGTTILLRVPLSGRVIHRDGRVRYVHKGFVIDKAPLYEAHITELLNER